MGNAKTRLAEAYTTSASSCPGTSIVDEGFSYSARGEITGVWEKTPNSGTYYHPTATYWANGALDVLWISSLPSITYNVEGEGRPSTVSASSGQNPVTLTNYNTAGQVTKVTFGSGDGDEFSYDANTGRMTQYKLWANGSNAYGNLGWNANGTLGSLNITDPFNPGDNQNCSYAYDDLVRLSSVNCGSPWSQTFTYDAFGNITKSGSISWQPGYNLSTNRYTLGGTSYDSNGNLLNDTFHSYTWDSDSNPATIDSIALTYDAFDRVVEQNQSGTFYQMVYTPMGTKMGKFKAGVIQQLYVPLPGGAQAEYYSWGLSNYRHADWLGSDRMQSDASTHSVTDNNAYAPFGEQYAQTGNGEISVTGAIKDTDWLQYDFLARQYDPKQGRWTSPDPAGLGAVDPTNPQSWNRYAYVINNPLALTDPTGMDFCQGGNSPNASMPSSESNQCAQENMPAYHQADYNTETQPVPDWHYLQNQTWGSVDKWFNDQGIAEYAPLPTGLVNGFSKDEGGPGDIGILGAQQADIAFKEIVNKMIFDALLRALDAPQRLDPINPLSIVDAVNSLNAAYGALGNLEDWQKHAGQPSPPPPNPMKCGSIVGQALGPWLQGLKAWLKENPGQQPPAAIANPPSLPRCNF
jgi:RHS repeat-associated protein